MNATERAEFAAAIATHLPGLPAEAAEWHPEGVIFRVAGATITVARWAGQRWHLYGMPDPRPGDRKHNVWRDPDAILTAVRAHLVTALAHSVTALATARADVAAYERALWPPCRHCEGAGKRRPTDEFDCIVCDGTRVWTAESEASTAAALLARVPTFDDPDVSAVFDAVDEAFGPAAYERALGVEAGEMYGAKSDCWLCESLPDGYRCGDPKCGPHPDASGSAGR